MQSGRNSQSSDDAVDITIASPLQLGVVSLSSSLQNSNHVLKFLLPQGGVGWASCGNNTGYI